jgi:hypothetical protein
MKIIDLISFIKRYEIKEMSVSPRIYNDINNSMSDENLVKDTSCPYGDNLLIYGCEITEKK